jgi:4-hydroxy-tetrahydrodipicolinate synthase
MITPFKENGSLDVDGLTKLTERQLEAGVQGIAPLGVTGENTLITDEEELTVLRTIVKAAKGKCNIVPDTCASSLWKAKEKVKAFADIGATHISVFSPYFVLPQPSGVIKFYEEVAGASPVPILLHNSQDRTGINMEPATSAQLAKHPNILGIKDGNKALDHLAKLVYLTKEDDFEVYTGKDTTAYPLISFGGAGSFSVSANVIPGVMREMIDLALKGDFEKARQIHYEYYDLYEAMRWETNPMAAKMAMNLMGLPAGGLRMPLMPLNEEKTKKLKVILQKKNLIK